MAAADVLKNYLHFEDMEENSFKRMLSNALNKVNEENADYVTSLLKADIDAFFKRKVLARLEKYTYNASMCTTAICSELPG